MIQSFYIPGQLPGLNKIIKASISRHPKFKDAKFTGYARMKNEMMDRIGLFIIQAHLKPVKEAYIEFQWHELTKKRDPDNIAAGGRKFILDALVKAGILKNDGWAQIQGFHDTFFVDKRNEGVGVIINGN